MNLKSSRIKILYVLYISKCYNNMYRNNHNII